MRRRMTGFLTSLEEAELAARSGKVAQRLMETEQWKSAHVVLCYLAMPHELDTSRLIDAARASGKRLAVPRIEGGVIRFLYLPAGTTTLSRDSWGIPVPEPSWEPFEPAAAGRVLVAAPGLAFDRRGNRLGRGKGFYDGFLRAARAAPGSDLVVIGLCFSEQLVDEVPHDERDEPLQGVVTDRETVIVS